MPLYKTKYISRRKSSNSQILIWKVTETYAELLERVVLNLSSSIRLDGMKSEMHQRAFLSVRILLQDAGYTDLDLYYDDNGKPHLHGDKHISITHSHNFAAIIISDEIVGIDMEMRRDKIIRIAHKFCDSEFQFLNQDDQEYIQKLTVIWGAKEAIFKIRNEKGISFKNHIKVLPFELQNEKVTAELHYDTVVKDFTIHFEEIEAFSLVYAFEK